MNVLRTAGIGACVVSAALLGWCFVSPPLQDPLLLHIGKGFAEYAQVCGILMWIEHLLRRRRGNVVPVSEA